jgi:hypothetical protein
MDLHTAQVWTLQIPTGLIPKGSLIKFEQKETEHFKFIK